MRHWPGFVLLFLSVALLAIAAKMEHTQRSERGPVAIVPTLPYAFAAALIAALGMVWLTLVRYAGVTWWFSVAAFVATLVFGAWLIIAVGRRAEKRRG